MMTDEGEMPLFFVMRCGEWWASSPVLRGSQHPCPLLPTTHLADSYLLGDVKILEDVL